jgi:hypothetical protein
MFIILSVISLLLGHVNGLALDHRYDSFEIVKRKDVTYYVIISISLFWIVMVVVSLYVRRKSRASAYKAVPINVVIVSYKNIFNQG